MNLRPKEYEQPLSLVSPLFDICIAQGPFSSPDLMAFAASSSTGPSPSAARRPLVWLGDLNVAAGWNDVGPDPDWFRHQNGQTALDDGNKGQPGFTANEQARFAALLETGQLIDAYRQLHPAADWRRDVTWRGTPGVNNPSEGRYYNKGMRIDYVCVSSSLAPRIQRAVVHGKGPERSGFLGSDHCPLSVELGSTPPGAVADVDVGASGSSVDENAPHKVAKPGEAV